MAGRLIVVSNRIPTEDVPSGGLVVALHEALSETGGLWIGADPEVSERPTDALRDLGGNGYEKKAFRMTEGERRGYYLGYANSVLWPLCHRRTDLISLDPGYAKAYSAVNQRVARAVAALAAPDDLIWVQDYHFLPLAAALRAEGVTARIGLFLHIPFPVAADIDALPQREAFLDWISAYDLVGLQTRADVGRCLEMLRIDAASVVLSDGRIKRGARVFSVRSFPIGIDVEAFAEAAVAQQPDMQKIADGGPLVIGVDRLDYSKGIPQRIEAFGAYLDQRGHHEPRPQFIQIAPPSREEVKAYREIRREAEAIAGHVNGQHAELDWTPIRFINRGFPREVLAPLFRAARAALVTPLADGMNLVAKEFLAAQDPADPGVLILSRMAGAAEELTEALLVNPHDIDEMAEAIRTALSMPLDERRARHAALMRKLRANDIAAWTRRYLHVLGRCEPMLSLPEIRPGSAGPRIAVVND